MTLTARIAYVGPNRQMYAMNRPGDAPVCLTGGTLDIAFASWGASAPVEGLHSWPTWSPSGDRIACFRIGEDGRSGARVVVAHADGIQSSELATLDAQIPIYLQWSPNGENLAVLCQKDDQLRLIHVPAGGAGGDQRRHISGSPLFFTWTTDDAIAAFAGSSGEGQHAQMVLIDPADGERRLLPGTPCNFCAPVWTGNHLIYAAHHRKRVSILLADLNQMTVRELEVIDGLAALVAAPNGRTLARALADDDRSPYKSLALIDLDSGALRTVVELDCTAFFWLPNSNGLVAAQTDSRTGTVSWLRVDLDGVVTHLIDVKPTRDTRFYLRFFEQYSHSHPMIDPTGRFLLTAGQLEGMSDDGRPRLWQIPLKGGAPEDLGEGLFGVYGPAIEDSSR